jgi:predicted aldo/keto reductase-like oxidoreductase
MGAGLAAAAAGCSKPPRRSAEPAPASGSGTMPMRVLGRTGVKVSLVGLGGYHIGMPKDEQTGISLIRSAIDRGVTFMDNCWDYHEGQSEVRMGRALRDGYRERVFLMTKIDGQTAESATRQLDESLKRLQTDRIDLLQFHEIIRAQDPERIFAPKGAFEAVMRARQAGKVRFVGFTGHKDPAFHLAMIRRAEQEGFIFDTVQLPLNVMDAHFQSFEKRVVPLASSHNTGLIAMKALGAGNILKSGAVDAIECLHYAMNLPVSVVVTGCERMEVLDQALRAAHTFSPLSDSKVAQLLARTAPAAGAGKHEPYKTTEQFDGTTHHPEWLG